MIFDSWILIDGSLIAKGTLTEYGVECSERFTNPLKKEDLLKAIECARKEEKLELGYIPQKATNIPALYPKTVVIEAIPEWETIKTWYDL